METKRAYFQCLFLFTLFCYDVEIELICIWETNILKKLLTSLALIVANSWTCATALNCILNAAYFRFSMKLTFVFITRLLEGFTLFGVFAGYVHISSVVNMYLS
jgi:hypothetical protein